jgi:hypothetical protein|tara:strand:- start:503 stop:688 length:186 start_codon:yes stop_codon:yes gene_type:complete
MGYRLKLTEPIEYVLKKKQLIMKVCKNLKCGKEFDIKNIKKPKSVKSVVEKKLSYIVCEIP